jgi:hypothetical protein
MSSATAGLLMTVNPWQEVAVWMADMRLNSSVPIPMSHTHRVIVFQLCDDSSATTAHEEIT